MRKLVLIFAIAVLMVACKKEDDKVKPSNPNQPPVQEEYDCDSHPFWYIQIYQTCDWKGVSILTIRNEESKRIDSLYKMGGCKLINVVDYHGDTTSGYWFASMNGRDGDGSRNNCYRYGKD